jgi:hypothetical protein
VKGAITAWDSSRGVGVLRPDNLGSSGDLIVSTALFVESGLGQPHAGDRFAFRLRIPPDSRIEPYGFHRLIVEPAHRARLGARA